MTAISPTGQENIVEAVKEVVPVEVRPEPTLVSTKSIRNPRKKSKDLLVPTTMQLTHHIITKITSLKNKAYISFLYLTGCRVSEIVGIKERGIPPICASQLEVHGDILVVNNVHILKRREVMVKNIPIPMKKERELVLAFLQYASQRPIDEPLFPFGRRRALEIVKQELGSEYFNHYLRHCRVTRLTTDYGFNSNELVAFIGWKDSRQASIYSHLNWKDLAKKF